VANIFITGSADGLGKMAAQLLVAQGHNVTLHARNPQRAADAQAATPGAKDAISGDLSSGDPSLQDPAWEQRPWNGYNAYCDSKLHDVILAFAVARKARNPPPPTPRSRKNSSPNVAASPKSLSLLLQLENDRLEGIIFMPQNNELY
jgi:hypothetical protein